MSVSRSMSRRMSRRMSGSFKGKLAPAFDRRVWIRSCLLVAALPAACSPMIDQNVGSTGGQGAAGDPAGKMTGTGGTTGSIGSGGAPSSAGGGSGGGVSPGTGGGSGIGGAVAATGGAPGIPGSGGVTPGRGGAAGSGAGGATISGSGGSGAQPGLTCTPGAFVCEAFESYTVGSAPTGIWSTTVRGGGAITVDSTRAFTGTKSLHVTGVINGDVAHITTPLAISANTVFVRFMMYTIGYPSSSGVHSRLARLGTSADSGPDSAYSLSSYNGTAIEKVDSIYLRSVSTHLNDANLLNRWVCWEFEIDKTGGVGKVVPHIWLDGTALALAAAGSSSHAGTSTSWDPIAIEKFTLGLEGNQPDAVKGDFWLDDVAIASQKIGCAKP